MKPPQPPQSATQTTTTQLPDHVFTTAPDSLGKPIEKKALKFCGVTSFTWFFFFFIVNKRNLHKHPYSLTSTTFQSSSVHQFCFQIFGKVAWSKTHLFGPKFAWRKKKKVAFMILLRFFHAFFLMILFVLEIITYPSSNSYGYTYFPPQFFDPGLFLFYISFFYINSSGKPTSYSAPYSCTFTGNPKEPLKEGTFWESSLALCPLSTNQL